MIESRRSPLTVPSVSTTLPTHEHTSKRLINVRSLNLFESFESNDPQNRLSAVSTNPHPVLLQAPCPEMPIFSPKPDVRLCPLLAHPCPQPRARWTLLVRSGEWALDTLYSSAPRSERYSRPEGSIPINPQARPPPSTAKPTPTGRQGGRVKARVHPGLVACGGGCWKEGAGFH